MRRPAIAAWVAFFRECRRVVVGARAGDNHRRRTSATLLAYDPLELEKDYHWAKDGRIALNWAGEAQEVALRKRSAPAKPPDPASGRQFVPNQATGPIDSKYGNWRPEHDHTPTDRHGAY